MILIVDDMPIFREPIAACLKVAGYETDCAATSLEALAKIQKQAPDLILLDVSMPGMDGIALLQKLRSRPDTARTPIFMLTAMSDRDRIVQAGKYGVQEYLLKSRFTAKDLISRVEKYIKANPLKITAGTKPGTAASALGLPSGESAASGPVARISPLGKASSTSRDEYLERARKTTMGKALAGVIGQVMSLAASPRGDMAQLASLISRDPTLAARVLSASNSAAYTSTRGICTTIGEAVKQIGFTTVRNIAAAVGVFDAMPKPGQDGFSAVRGWQHSFAVAQLCEQLESSRGTEASTLSYVIGLCHDLADMIVRSEFAGEYADIFQAEHQATQSRAELQKDMMGVSHRELVALVTASIGLPDAIRLPIEAFHNGHFSNDEMGRHAASLRLADQYANGLLLAADGDSVVGSFLRDDCQTITGEEHPARPDVQQFSSQVRCLTITLAKLGASEESQLLIPMYPKAATRVWLARDPALSHFNPLESALSCMANVTVNERLPSVPETSQMDALIVLAHSAATRGFTEEAICSISQNQQKQVIWFVAEELDKAGSSSIRPMAWPIQLRILAQLFCENAASAAA